MCRPMAIAIRALASAIVPKARYACAPVVGTYIYGLERVPWNVPVGYPHAVRVRSMQYS